MIILRCISISLILIYTRGYYLKNFCYYNFMYVSWQVCFDWESIWIDLFEFRYWHKHLWGWLRERELINKSLQDGLWKQLITYNMKTVCLFRLDSLIFELMQINKFLCIIISFSWEVVKSSLSNNRFFLEERENKG
jgi:hypothetical protein